MGFKSENLLTITHYINKSENCIIISTGKGKAFNRIHFIHVTFLITMSKLGMKDVIKGIYLKSYSKLYAWW